MHPAGSDESLSLWIDTTPSTSYPALEGNTDADVAIVGGGITGITAAYLLAKGGRSVVLIDKGRVAMSETGHTTAHIVESTDADYEQLIKDHGEENARLNTAACRDAMRMIRELVAELGIDCGLETVDGYLYAEDPNHVEYLQRQQTHLQKAGVEVAWVDRAPLPFATVGALHFTNQQIFHIRKYLLPLLEAAVKLGVRVYEQTRAFDIDNAKKTGRCSVETEHGRISAEHVILATHVPINDRGTLWAKMHTTRTYVVAAPIERGRVPNALYWDTVMPYHYTRLLETDRGLFLIVGGEDRDTGHKENEPERYRELERYARERFGVTEFPYRWSGQINEPADMIPYIGKSTHGENVWMATGYSGTGMTYGTTAAMLLADLALGRDNVYAKLFDPGRFKFVSVAENVITKASKGPARLAAKLLNLDVDAKSFEEVAEGEGKIVQVDGEKYAVCRVDGKLCAVSPTCTHMGCTVEWNAAEKSWDCPCHGSRFSRDGHVLNSPASEPLEKMS